MPLLIGAGKGALFITEELAFYEGPRDSAAVNRHKRAVPPAAGIVNGLGEQFLPRPALAGN